MNGTDVALLLDGKPVQGQHMTLDAAAQFDELTFSLKMTLGTHDIRVRSSVRYDTNWTNNEANITVNAALPDLKVSAFRIGLDNLYPGQPLKYSYNVTNLGGWLGAADLKITLENQPLWQKQLTNLSLGFSTNVNGTLDTASLSYGTHTIWAYALPVGVDDRNMSDNQAKHALFIYHKDIELVVDTPMEGAQVAHNLSITGNATDLDKEGLEVWATLSDSTGVKIATKKVLLTATEPVNLTMDISGTDKGGYALTVYANGSRGRTASVVRNLKVMNGPYWEKLDPNAVNQTVATGKNLSFTAIARDWGTGGKVNVRWYLDGTDVVSIPQVLVVGDNLTYMPRRADAGTHHLKVEAWTNRGSVSRTWTISVTHTNRPPTIITVKPGAGNIIVLQGSSQNFSVNATDPDDDQLNYTWEYGGEAFYGPSITIKPQVGNNKTLLLTVSDGTASVAVSWNVVVVTKGKPPPPVIPTHPTTNVVSSTLFWGVLVAVVASVCGVMAYLLTRERPKAGKNGMSTTHSRVDRKK